MKNLFTKGCLAVVCIILMCACGTYTEEEAIFIVKNHTSDRAVAIVDGNPIAELAPFAVNNQEIVVLVPRRTGYYSYGPSRQERQVEVDVVFKNLRTGRLSRQRQCLAGDRVKTVISYHRDTVSSADDGYADCETLRGW